MAISDPIADMLTNIRNANKAGYEGLSVPHSKIKEEIVSVLKKNGFINDFGVVEEGAKKRINIMLKYGPSKEKVILGLKRISKCGRRKYVSKDKIPLIQGGLGIAIISTSKGLMTDKQAKEKQIGGEVICYVW